VRPKEDDYSLDDLVQDEKRQIWLWALLFVGAVIVLTFRDQLPQPPAANDPAAVESDDPAAVESGTR